MALTDFEKHIVPIKWPLKTILRESFLVPHICKPQVCIVESHCSGHHEMDNEELIAEDEPSRRPKNGINLFVAIVILTGEMAGSGMLQLPYSMVGTGKF